MIPLGVDLDPSDISCCMLHSSQANLKSSKFDWCQHLQSRFRFHHHKF